jgi:hypothetical protein
MSHVAMMQTPSQLTLQLPIAARPEAEEMAQTDAVPQALTMHKRCRVLLAVDGRHLSAEFQLNALKRCVQFCNHLDILLLNSPKSPTFLLAGLLLRLEHSGIDYRLASGEGDLGAEVMRYLQRFQSIGLVIVDGPPALERCLQVQHQAAHRKACRYISLSESLEGA